RCGSSPSIFCFHDTTATVIYTLSLHDALPILLNATLTVRAHQAASHQRRGWEEFTDQIIQQVSDKLEHVVFILWGSYAQRKSVLIDARKHFILKAVHPSPLSAHRGFFGSKPFSQANTYLASHGRTPIDWQI